MDKTLVALDRGCGTCGKPLFTTTPNNPNPKRFCNDACRYAYWDKQKLKELERIAGLLMDQLQRQRRRHREMVK